MSEQAESEQSGQGRHLWAWKVAGRLSTAAVMLLIIYSSFQVGQLWELTGHKLKLELNLSLSPSGLAKVPESTQKIIDHFGKVRLTILLCLAFLALMQWSEKHLCADHWLNAFKTVEEKS